MLKIKLSEYISKLQDVIDRCGDLECVTWIENDDPYSSAEGWYRAYDGDGTEFISDYACTYTDKSGKKQFATINQRGYIDCVQERVYEIR